MTPLKFEELYEADWRELEGLLDRAFGRRRRTHGSSEPARNEPSRDEPVRGERLAALYRRACEQLALARARAYPAYMLGRLDRLTADAHQLIYRRRDLGFARVVRLVAADFPRAVRAHAVYVGASALLFGIPLIAVGLLIFYRPELVLSIVSAASAAQYEQMYTQGGASMAGAPAAGNWLMFGSYISHNVGIAFQCFAGGFFFGIGSLFFLLYNGAVIGGIAGYLTERGLAAAFYSFVATHGAFELTAIVLSGAAGLRLGHALLAPGRRTRLQSLVLAARESAVIVYGLTVMLVVAAAIEAFWSAAAWIPPAVKYGVAALCWGGVLGYLTFQGRRAG
jgi:uncharacterized membrane protein SpoIIM required for sporulation